MFYVIRHATDANSFAACDMQGRLRAWLLVDNAHVSKFTSRAAAEHVMHADEIDGRVVLV